jgi:hypothetical protein
MSSTRRPFAAAVLLTAAGVMACSIISPPLAWAASAKPAAPAAPARDPALSGPRVTDREAPAVNNTFDGGSRPRDYGREIPMNVYGDLLKSTLGPEAPENVRASEDQSKQIRQIIEEFTRTQREFGRKNREQLEALRKQAGEQGSGPGNAPGRPGANRPQPGQPGQPPQPPKPPAGGDEPMMGEPAPASAPAPAPADEAKRNEARAKLEELRSQMPKPGDAQTKVWDLLSEPQREAMRLSIENWKQTEQESSNRRYLQQQREQRERAARAAGKEPAPEPAKAPGNEVAPPANPPQPKPPAPAQRPARPQNAGPQSGPNAAPGANLPPQVRDRALRLLERLTPEEREELFRRVEERLRDRGDNRPAPRGGDRPGQPAGGQPKPPSMDDVRVPPPPPPAPTAPPERQPR